MSPGVGDTPETGSNSRSVPVRVAVNGASGRLGQALQEAIRQNPLWQLSAAWVAKNDPLCGQETGFDGVKYAVLPEPGQNPQRNDRAGQCGQESCPQVVVDFSSPAALQPLLANVRQWKVPLVSGTTGLNKAQTAALREAGADIPLLWAPNFSLTVQLMQEFLARLARIHGDSWQACIEETHREGKKDAPSGTALALAHSLLKPGENQPQSPAIRLQKISDLSFALGPVSLRSHRVGQVAGIHEIRFSTPGEVLTLRHEAESPALFARSALQVAAWLIAQPPGQYQLKHYTRSVTAQKP